MENKDYCLWGYDSENICETSCGKAYQLNDGTPKQNGMKYCCYCGKKLKQYDQESDIKRIEKQNKPR